MWVVAEYEATTLFSLKPASATASGGKTLLVPTPYALRMALLDVACRLEGLSTAEEAWEWLSGLSVAVRPAQAVVVNNTFSRVLKPKRTPDAPGSQDAGYFGRTIAYREYAYLHGPFGVALEVAERAHAEQLRRWLASINYLGKRGSFIQIMAAPAVSEDLPDGFLIVSRQAETFPIDAIMTQLDDVGQGTDFEQVNIYSGKRISLGKQRVLHHVALPYRLVASSRSYSFYERTQG